MSIDLQSKSMDWFLYDRNRHESVENEQEINSKAFKRIILIDKLTKKYIKIYHFPCVTFKK